MGTYRWCTTDHYSRERADWWGQADVVTLNIGAGNGITVTADAIAVTAGKGITVDGSGVVVSVDGSSIIYDAANGNRLTVASIDGGTF